MGRGRVVPIRVCQACMSKWASRSFDHATTRPTFLLSLGTLRLASAWTALICKPCWYYIFALHHADACKLKHTPQQITRNEYLGCQI